MKSKLLILSLLVLLCTSCGVLRPKYITQVQHDTTVINKINNIFQHDSVYVFKDKVIKEKGDTVYITTTEYKYKWKIKEVHDTLYKDRIKYEEKEVPVKIEKPLTWIQKTLIIFGKLFFIILLIIAGYYGFKFYKKLKV